MTAGAANAGGLVHKMSSSVQLTVDLLGPLPQELVPTTVYRDLMNTTDGTTAGTILVELLLQVFFPLVIFQIPRQLLARHFLLPVLFTRRCCKYKCSNCRHCW